MAADPQAAQPTDEQKKKRHRSPNYPAIGLKEAVERTKKFYEQDGKAGAQAEIAARHIGFASAHGQAYSVLAALKRFGLVEDKDGRVVPTARAIEIISLPDSDQRRTKAIRQAALSPRIYRELIDQYKDSGLPAEDTLEGELKAYKNFNPNAVREFLKGFTETIEFAGLSDFSALDADPAFDMDREGTEISEQRLMKKPNPLDNIELTFSSTRDKQVRRYPLDISIPRRVTGELVITGDFRKEDIERLKKQLLRRIEDLEDAFQE
jgi:hypothetical protein